MPVLKYVLSQIIDRMNRLETPAPERTAPQHAGVGATYSGKHVVLIDDCMVSGQTMILAKKLLAGAGARLVTTGVITFICQEKEPLPPAESAPHFYLTEGIMHYFPWSQNNAAYNDYLSWLSRNGIDAWN